MYNKRKQHKCLVLVLLGVVEGLADDLAVLPLLNGDLLLHDGSRCTLEAHVQRVLDGGDVAGDDDVLDLNLLEDAGGLEHVGKVRLVAQDLGLALRHCLAGLVHLDVVVVVLLDGGDNAVLALGWWRWCVG